MVILVQIVCRQQTHTLSIQNSTERHEQFCEFIAIYEAAHICHIQVSVENPATTLNPLSEIMKFLL